MARINKVFNLLFWTMILISCTSSNDLYNYLNQHRLEYIEETGSINIKEFYNVEFDRFYIIGESNDRETIENFIRIPYENENTVSDSMNRLIFIKDNKVIYEIDIDGHEIYFDSADKTKELHSPTFKVIAEGDRTFLLKNQNMN